MKPIYWRKWMLDITDLYGSDRDIPRKKTDITIVSQLPKDKIQGKYHMLKRFKTLHIDLEQTEDELFKAMNRTTRYQINRAFKESHTVTILDTPSVKDIEEFVQFFIPFAKEKDIPPCSHSKLLSLRKEGMLVLTKVVDKDGRKLASHAYSLTEGKASMIHSCSGRFEFGHNAERNRIGRANRLLHWNDMLYFKGKHFKTYDFVGLSFDDRDKAMKNITEFKKGFGGREVMEYKYYKADSLAGKAVLFVLSKKWEKNPDFVEASFK
ncbi:hypothetical protein [Bacillus sp. KH172YL63]|uniref:hypothetical protein n=1 Tax=Bacillus sp. KH172YL63 TaxID=2709784 RepID=UPI0013E49404|nr:hypothetical protein [Bacillus sp. KH172YL63]BCB05660.1 hypothetical protein KH172YL63_37930 [Bacillus sp. KH172YL63]